MDKTNSTKKKLSPDEQQELLNTLKVRFESNMNRHKGIAWASVEERLEPNYLWSLNEMEQTGGEPDVVGYGNTTGEYIFYDCAEESPKGRRNICYDRAALDARRHNKPGNSAIDMAEDMGITILSEKQYRDLQELGKFDVKTQSWILTPPEIRKRGGALFCDRRYDHVFVYHNGADAYYAGRGFRGMLKV